MIVTVGQIAQAWGISVHQVNKLAKNGTIPKASRGKYEIIGATHAYIDYIRKGRDEERRDEIRREELAILRLDKEKKEDERNERRARVVSVDDVATIFSRLASSIRSILLASPKRISHELGKPELEDALNPHFRQTLDELATLPNDATGVFKALRSDLAERVRDIPAASGADDKPVGRSQSYPRHRARRKRPVAHK